MVLTRINERGSTEAPDVHDVLNVWSRGAVW